MDKAGANFEKAVISVRKLLCGNCVPIQ